MQGDECEVVLGLDRADGRPDEVNAHQQGEYGANGYGEERESEVADAEGAVVGAQQRVTPR